MEYNMERLGKNYYVSVPLFTSIYDMYLWKRKNAQKPRVIVLPKVIRAYIKDPLI